MKNVMAMVQEFHVAMDLPVANNLGFPDDARVKLRDALIEEEYLELLDATSMRDMVEVADALADMVYIIAGTALEYGIPLERVFAEVHRSNMAKVDPETGKVRRRADGKVLKPAQWAPPDIKSILDAV